MKIGYYNIFPTTWFLVMLSSCGILLDLLLFGRPQYGHSFLSIGSVPVVLIIIMAVAALIPYTRRFQLLLVNNNEIISIQPLQLKRTIIQKGQVKEIYWTPGTFRTHSYLSVELIDEQDKKIVFSDFEFANFASLAAAIASNEYPSKVTGLLYAQARNNGWQNIVWLFFSIACFVALFCISGLNPFSLTVMIVLGLMIWASVKRWYKYSIAKKLWIAKKKALTHADEPIDSLKS